MSEQGKITLEQQRIMSQFDQVAEQLDRGDISKEEADARGEEIMQELQRQTISDAHLQVQLSNEKRKSQIVFRLAAVAAILACLFLVSRFLG